MSAATPTRPLPTAVREKLGKPLLSSNLDGEWVGAVAAIERVLKSAGLEALRASRRFTARSEEFLDSLLERAGRFEVVHLSPKQKRWVEDPVLKAKGASA
jgi:hypothetical protein